MEKNAGMVDRIVRAVIGIILLYAVATGMVQGIPMYIAGILGLMMVVTAALAYCPLYPVAKNKYCDKAEIGGCFFLFCTKTGSKGKKAYLTYMYI